MGYSRATVVIDDFKRHCTAISTLRNSKAGDRAWQNKRHLFHFFSTQAYFIKIDDILRRVRYLQGIAFALPF